VMRNVRANPALSHHAQDPCGSVLGSLRQVQCWFRAAGPKLVQIVQTIKLARSERQIQVASKLH